MQQNNLFSICKKKLMWAVQHPGCFPILYLLLVTLYSFVGYSSFGYDDEFANITLIEKHGLKVVDIVQHTDVHPPGSYIVNWLLYSLFDGDWHLVRLLTSLFTVVALVYAIESVRKKYGYFSGLITFLLLGLNPAILLWCTGIRWYAYFIPILIWLSIVPRTNNLRYWFKCFGGLFLLGYFGYAVFVIAIPILILYWRNCIDNTLLKIKHILIAAGLFGLLYGYQLIIFATVHLDNKASQVGSLLKGILGFGIAQFSNQGIFPLSFAGIISSIGVLGILVISLRFSSTSNIKNNQYFIPYCVGTLFIILSGLATKFRNFIILSPLQALWISTIKIDPEKRKFQVFFLICILFGNLVGVFNVVTHDDTTKNSWNMPVDDVLNYVLEQRTDCKGDLAVLTHDIMLTTLLIERNFKVLGPYSYQAKNQPALNRAYQCVMVLKTYKGSLSDLKYNSMYRELDAIKHTGVSQHLLGFDKYYHLKKLLDARYPKYQVEVLKYSDVINLDKLYSWHNKKQPVQ